MTTKTPKLDLSRRDLLRLMTQAGLISPFAGGLSPFMLASPAQAAATPHKFLQIFLGGGWDVNLATNPVIAGSAKATSGHFWDAYYNSGSAAYAGNSVAISGKSNLRVGPGLAAAASGFAAVPTAFVNGMFVEVTAHELAVAYLLTGRLSLSRSREYPSFISLMADTTGGFPAHVILGGGAMPLADTAKTNPPLQSLNADTFVKMLAGPYKSDDGNGLKPGSINAAHSLIGTLNASYQQRIGRKGKASLSAWDASEAGLKGLYAKRFDQKLAFTTTIQNDFGTGTGDDFDGDGVGAKLALAHMVLREGVSRYASVLLDGYDTHSNHMTSHLPLMQTFATRLNTLIGYLASTNDPDTPSKKLIETTTVLITSEFNRTPTSNGAGGTDHWQTGSAIVMGRGVTDNTVIGTTDVQGNAENFGGAPLLPDHLAASLLRHLGFGDAADSVSEVHLDALFT